MLPVIENQFVAQSNKVPHNCGNTCRYSAYFIPQLFQKWYRLSEYNRKYITAVPNTGRVDW